jgi:dynein heavy chain
VLDVSEAPANPDPEFFSQKSWEFIYAIQILASQNCFDLCQHITLNLEDWKTWASSDSPHLTQLPCSYEDINEAHYLHRLLVVKALCPEKVMAGVQQHTRQALGAEFVVFPTPSMPEIYADTTQSTPVIFVLTTGADPTGMLLRFCQEMGMESSLGVISLGQGQGPKAQKLIDESTKKGHWVLLQNCHLAKSWMPALEKICEHLEESPHIHKTFRLFLTSMPADYFPVPVLQNGVKMTNEPPKGLRANVKRSFQAVTDEDLNNSAKPGPWKRVQFALKFYHAVIQERRKFGPLGWNIRYEFNDSDLETSTTILHNMLELDGDVPWDTLLFVVGQINYGGRVTDDWDRRCLMAILSQYVTPQILQDDYVFSPSGTYRCPDNVDAAGVEDFNAYCDSLPLVEAPEVYGMHENANVSFQQQESDQILSVVLSIQPRESGGGAGQTPEDLVLDIVKDQTEKLPSKISDENPHPTAFQIMEETGLMSSLGTILGQEMQRFNDLISGVGKSLADVQKAIKGLIVMTGDLDSMFQALLNNQVPDLWKKVAYPSLKPCSSFFADFLLRVEFCRDWVEQGIPSAFWVSALFFPQGFLTAILQNYSRTNAIPVDILGFEFIVQDFDDPADVEAAPDEGALIYGMFCDGCRWDYENMVVADQEFGVMYTQAPIIHFVPCENYKPDPEQYTMPLYKTSVRAGTLSTTGHSTNFVLPLEVDTAETPTYWILKGAAFLTMLND